MWIQKFYIPQSGNFWLAPCNLLAFPILMRYCSDSCPGSPCNQTHPWSFCILLELCWFIELTTVFWSTNWIWLKLKKWCRTDKCMCFVSSNNIPDYLFLVTILLTLPVPVVARSKVCGRLPAEIVGLNPTGCMDVCCVCCKVEVSATGWSLVQRSPTDCRALSFVTQKPRDWGGLSLLGAVAPKTNVLLTLIK